MIKITDKDWDRYIDALRKINDEAGSKMFSYLAHNEWWASNRARQAALDYAYGLATKYGEAGASLAAEFYDMIAEASLGTLWAPAVPADTATYGEVANAVLGTMKSGNDEMISSAVSRLVKMAEVDTTLNNALRDGAEWAWIPRGDTCPYCIMLAGHGWQKARKSAIVGGHGEHVHANCDCMYAVRFDSGTEVEGYDYKAYARQFNATSGTTEDKLNAMRRRYYEDNAAKINAQKRAAYAKRQERESSAAEETDVT